MRIDFLPLDEERVRLMASWLRRPHVAEWWGTPDTVDELRNDYLITAGNPPLVRGYIATLDGRPLGFIQSYVVKGAGDGWWDDETDPGARGIDQFLAEESDLGRGLGTLMVRTFVERLFTDPEVTKVQTDPSPDNARAIRAYEKAGFRRLHVVDTPDGPALLMVVARRDLPQPVTSPH